jgi:hypothetical protein
MGHQSIERKNGFVLGNRQRNCRLVKSVARSQNLRRRGLLDERVDNVEEATNAVGVLRSDRDEGDWYTACHTNRVLNVQVLCKWDVEAGSVVFGKESYSLPTSLCGRLRVNTSIDGLEGK